MAAEALPLEVLSLIVGRDPFQSLICRQVRADWEAAERAHLARLHPDLPADRAAATPVHQLATFLRPRRTESPAVRLARQTPGAPDRIDDAHQAGDWMLVLSHGRVLSIGDGGGVLQPGGVAQLSASDTVLLMRMYNGVLRGTLSVETTSADPRTWPLQEIPLGDAPRRVVDICAGPGWAYALDADGCIWGWGSQESTFLAIGQNEYDEALFDEPVQATEVIQDDRIVDAPPFAKMSVAGTRYGEEMMCAVARDGTVYGCGYHFKSWDGGYQGLLTRLPDPPALVRDIVALVPPAVPRYRLHTMGEPCVAALVITGPGFDQDSNKQCVVEFDPSAPLNYGPGPLALLVDGTVFSLLAQRRVLVIGRAVALVARGEHAEVHGPDGSVCVLTGV